MDTNDDKYLVKIVTLQPANFKALFGILKENNVAEANISINQDGIEILEMDPTHIIITHVLLNASNFDSFYCREPIKIGVDTVNLTKILKGVGTKDILTLFVEDPKEKTDGGDTDASISFGLLIENSSKGQSAKIYIDTMDVNDRQLDVPELNYPYHVQLPASDLQSIATNLKNMGGDVIKLLFHRDTLQFFTRGEIGVSEITRSKTTKEDTSIKIQKNKMSGDDSSIIEIYVKLEKLVEFTKCSCLSPMVTIYLKNDFPLFLEYDVGSLGFIRLGVSPHNKPDNY
jgi:proliferating cell nuclear antigen PCNA